MKKLLFVLALLVSGGVFAQENVPMVSVTGEGTVEVVPDKVQINARVEHNGDSASEVKRQNEEVVNQIFQFLESRGVESENIQTEYLRLNKDHNYQTKEDFYSANQAISIQLDNLEDYEEIMSGLMESGLNRIDGIEFQTSKKEELESEARQKAMLDAQEKARELASAVGQSIGYANKISEMETSGFQPVYRMAEMQAFDSSSAKQTIAPGEMEITVKVNVGFLLRND